MTPSTFSAILDSNLLSTLVGGVIAAGASIGTTHWFNSKHDLKMRAALASALVFRIADAGNEVASLLRYFKRSEEIHTEKGQPRDQLWASVKQLVGLPKGDLSYDASELAILSGDEDNDLVVRIMELINARNIAVENVKRLNVLREDIDNLSAPLTKFAGNTERVLAQIDFEPEKYPELVGKMHKANGLALQLLESLTQSYQLAQGIGIDLKKALPKYFPKGAKLKSVTFPDID